jgi:hypothetical protein
MEDLNPKIRELIDAMYEGTIAEPVFVGTGQVYFVPSKSKDEVPFHIVSKVQFTDKGKTYRGWICSCRAFAFGKEEKTWQPHIHQVREEKETSSKSSTASKSKPKTVVARAKRSTTTSATAKRRGKAGGSKRTKGSRSTSSATR